jgi:uncharacterized protein YbgA (DUF1722 family)
VAIGLGTPRPPIRLVAVHGETRVRGIRDASIDVTDALQAYARSVVPRLEGLSGYVFKSKSPSCGLYRVKRYRPDGHPDSTTGRGAFAAVLHERLQHLPMEEEGRLNDPVLRENFVARVFAWQRWQALRAGGLDAATLIDFHTRHKYLLMAHSQAAYKRLGRLLSDLSGADLDALADEYQAEFMSALARRVSRARHVNVLQHLQGYLKRAITPADKVEIATAIEEYRRGEVPLVVPIRLLLHYFRCYPDEYIAAQAYLDPYPARLGLRNHI